MNMISERTQTFLTTVDMTVFKCPYPSCGKEFKRRDYFQRHEMNHAEVKPYQCKLCRNGFARRDLFEKHQRSKSHTRIRRLKGSQGKNMFVNLFSDQESRRRGKSMRRNDLSPKIDSDLGMEREINNLHSISTTISQDLSGSSEMFLDMNAYATFTNGHEESYGWLFGNEEMHTVNNDINFDSDLLKFTSVDCEWDSESLQSQFASDSHQRIVQVILDTLNVQFDGGDAMSLENFNSYLDLYWKNFNPPHPIIHRPTLSLLNEDLSHDLLIISMISLGISFNQPHVKPNNDYLAESIVDGLILKLLVSSQKFQNLKQIPLSLLQAMVLVDFFISSQGSLLQRQKSTMFHPFVINLLRERNLYDSLDEPSLKDHNRSEYYWQQWVEFESLKRLAFFEYIIDAKQAFFFSRNQSISLFEIQLDLPYSDAVWYSTDCETFLIQYDRQPREQRKRQNISTIDTEPPVLNDERVCTNEIPIPNVKNEGRWPNFLWSLRRLTQPYSKDHKEYHLDCFPQFSRYIFLHGVLSLVKELQNMSILGLLVVPKNQLNIMAFKIEQSFFSWKRYFHKQIADTNAASLNVGTTILMNDYGTSPLFWSNLTLYNIGLLGLYCEFPIILKFGETANTGILSNMISEDRSKYRNLLLRTCYMKLDSWARSKLGSSSNTRACIILRTMFANEEIIATVSHGPFAIYVSALICWCYQVRNFPDYVPGHVDREMLSSGQSLEAQASSYLSFYDEDPGNSRKDIEEPFKMLSMVRALVQYLASVLQRNCHSSRVSNQIGNLLRLVESPPDSMH